MCEDEDEIAAAAMMTARWMRRDGRTDGRREGGRERGKKCNKWGHARRNATERDATHGKMRDRDHFLDDGQALHYSTLALSRK